MKKTLLIIVALVVVVGAFLYWKNRTTAPVVEVQNPTAAQKGEKVGDINSELNSIQETNVDAEFGDIDATLKNL